MDWFFQHCDMTAESLRDHQAVAGWHRHWPTATGPALPVSVWLRKKLAEKRPIDLHQIAADCRVTWSGVHVQLKKLGLSTRPYRKSRVL